MSHGPTLQQIAAKENEFWHFRIGTTLSCFEWMWVLDISHVMFEGNLIIISAHFITFLHFSNVTIMWYFGYIISNHFLRSRFHLSSLASLRCVQDFTGECKATISHGINDIFSTSKNDLPLTMDTLERMEMACKDA